MSASGHFLPVIILSPDRQLPDAKRHFGTDFSTIEDWPAAFSQSNHSNCRKNDAAKGGSRPKAEVICYSV